MERETKWILAIAAIGIIYLFSQSPGESRVINTMWQEEYITMAQDELPAYETMTANTAYYDYDSPVIEAAAEDILSRSGSAKEAMELTADYVYDRVDYVYEGDDACYSGTAPDIIKKGTGQCDTQSITVISILRKIGIAAVPVGGCVMTNKECVLQSFLAQSTISFGKIPKIEPIEIGDQAMYSRGWAGLHAWVEAWDPEEGWIVIESTAGKLADTSCYTYHVEVFPGNNNKNEICATNNRDYALACRTEDISLLNKEGEGLVTEVSP